MSTSAMSIELSSNWHFKERDESLTVLEDFESTGNGWLKVKKMPSDVYVELLDNGTIPDPYIGFNEHDVQWVADKEWLYKTEFVLQCKNEEKYLLEFEGLDTFCKVYLNNSCMLTANNMFTPYTVELDSSILKSTNTLLLHFESAKKIAKEEEAKFGTRRAGSCNLGDPSRVYVRKAQYHWRWDWGPEIISVGPWRPIYLKLFSTRISTVHTRARLLGNLTPHLTVEAEVDGNTNKELYFEMSVISSDGEVVLQTTCITPNAQPGTPIGIFEGEIERAKLWWPTGYGRQFLYNVEMALYAKGGQKLDQQTKRVGFRSVTLIQKPLEEPDQYGKGTTFFFEVNGVPIYMGGKYASFTPGSNWVPADNLLTTIEPERYRLWLQLLKDGNQNMVRIWGGGVYEPDIFYDTCDELGLLIWHDFQFACGVYPAHPEFLASVKKEAECNVQRLRHHPSLALWCGNNEDYQQVLQWGDVEELPARVIYESILPHVVSRLTYDDIPYWRGSPYGGDGWDTANPTVGDVHQWNIWAGKGVPWQNYNTMGGRFVSEFGIPAIPDIRTVDYWMQHKEGQIESRYSKYRYSNSPLMAQHNKAGSHEQRFGVFMSENFRVTGDFDSHIFLTQVLQSEAVSFAYRSWKREWRGEGREYNGGTLVWQSNDSWPVTSWAIADYFLRPKPAYYTIARALDSITIGSLRVVKQNRVHDRPIQFYEFGAFRSQSAELQIWGTNSTLREMSLNLHRRYFNIYDPHWSEATVTQVRLQPNQAAELWKGPLLGRDIPLKELPTSSAHVIVSLQLVDSSGKVVARYADWPQPFRYIDFPDPGLEVVRGGAPGDEWIDVKVSRPAKCVVFSVRDVKSDSGKGYGEEVKWEDNALDLFPGDVRRIGCKGLGKKAIWCAWMGNEKAIKMV